MLRSLKIQFFLTYAVMGSIVPLLSTVLKDEKHFTETEIGIFFSLLSFAIVLSPVLVTFLADTRIDTRRLLTAALIISAAMLAGIGLVTPVVLVMALFFIHALVYSPMIPLHDGFYFSATGEKGKNAESGDDEKSDYNRVRIWGSVGFIAPTAPLYLTIQQTGDPNLCFYIAAGFGLVAALHAFRLPRVNITKSKSTKPRSIPTMDAFNVLRSPKVRWFCIAMALAYIAGNAYYAFFPVYLRNEVGLDPELIPVLTNLGVVLELFFIAGLEWLRRKFGFRRLILIGIGCMVVRLTAIALFPSVTTAILVQVLHGPEILALFILPVMFLNREAGDGFRNSIQGLYVMLVSGAPRIVGSTFSGIIADHSILLLYGVSAWLALVAFFILFFKFKPERRRTPPPEGGGFADIAA